MNVQQYIEILNVRFQTGISREHVYRGDLQRLLECVIGQNIAPIESALRDRDHTLDFGNLSKRIRNSHKDINNAISHNR